jgi:hypothetical protein
METAWSVSRVLFGIQKTGIAFYNLIFGTGDPFQSDTMIYANVLNRRGLGVYSPMDML